jgi:hypothetical protein
MAMREAMPRSRGRRDALSHESVVDPVEDGCHVQALRRSLHGTFVPDILLRL